MRSIKPGRGPSMMGGVMGIFVTLFGIYWTILASRAGGVMVIFGVFFVVVAIVQTVYNFKNATGKNRYSHFDITEDTEEPDPLNEAFGYKDNQNSAESNFCPYCGTMVTDEYTYCNKCGKRLP